MAFPDRIYRALLVIMPAGLRREFGDDMVQMFRDQRRVRGRRPVALAALWIAAIHDIVTHAIAAHREERRTRGPLFSGGTMRAFTHDLRHGVRLIGRQPGASILAIATLALGIGVSAAIFSVVDAVMLRDLPYAKPERLVMVWEKRPAEGVLNNVVSPADFLDWRSRQEPFDRIAAVTESSATLTGHGDALAIDIGVSSADFFDVLGVTMARGRTFDRNDEVFGRHRKVILSHAFWTSAFGGDPAVVGTNLTLNGTSWEVIGILPASFRYLTPGLEVWVPSVLETPEQPAPRGSHQLLVYARLKDGVSLEESRDAMDRLGRQLEQEHLDTNKGHSAWVTTLREEYVGPQQTSLVVLFAAVGLVLLIACANVASLQIARSIARRREMAVRSALGASRPRLVGQSLTEHLALSIIGGLTGLFVAWLTLRGLPLILPEQISVIDVREISLNLRVLGFALFVTLLTSAIVGVLPALAASRQNAIETIKIGGRSHASVRRRARGLLVVSEVTLATLTLVGAGLVYRSFATTMAQPMGFDPHNRLTVGVAVPAARYATPELRRLKLEEIEDRLRKLPNVTAAGGTVFLPLGGGDARSGITFENREVREGDPPTRMHPRVVTPTYFEALGIPIARGRGFTTADTLAAQPVVLISESAVRQFYADEDPIGKRVQFGSDGVWRTIVGVTGDVKHWGLRKPANPTLYWPQGQAQRNYLTFVLKTTGDPMAVAPAVRAQIAAVDPLLAILDMSTMDEVVSESVKSERAQAVMMGAFGVLALLLAVIGIYGITSQLVVARVPEIGVRMTLGARPRDVLRQFVREGLGQTAIGLAIGLVAGALLMRLADTLLFNVEPWDPATLAAVSIVLLVAALVACVIPARRAMNIDPATTIRQ